MLAAEQFLSFLAAAMLITLSPGPDNLMVLGVGISRGRAQGMAFGLGCALGCLSHTLLAALGVSALIAASPEVAPPPRATFWVTLILTTAGPTCSTSPEKSGRP